MGVDTRLVVLADSIYHSASSRAAPVAEPVASATIVAPVATSAAVPTATSAAPIVTVEPVEPADSDEREEQRSRPPSHSKREFSELRRADSPASAISKRSAVLASEKLLAPPTLMAVEGDGRLVLEYERLKALFARWEALAMSVDRRTTALFNLQVRGTQPLSQLVVMTVVSTQQLMLTSYLIEERSKVATFKCGTSATCILHWIG